MSIIWSMVSLPRMGHGLLLANATEELKSFEYMVLVKVIGVGTTYYRNKLYGAGKN